MECDFGEGQEWWNEVVTENGREEGCTSAEISWARDSQGGFCKVDGFDPWFWRVGLLLIGEKMRERIMVQDKKIVQVRSVVYSVVYVYLQLTKVQDWLDKSLTIKINKLI